MNIFEKMAAITAELQTVAKNLTVGTGNNQYKAVSERDILDAVKPLEEKHGVYSYPASREVLESNLLESEDTFTDCTGQLVRKSLEGLNGDILIYNPVLESAFEISSMGIRVDGESLKKQLKKKGELDKLSNPYCSDIINGKLPITIGGGIGQSRLCMFFLNKAHIGEVQSSVWSDESVEENAKKGIHLL